MLLIEHIFGRTILRIYEQKERTLNKNSVFPPTNQAYGSCKT